MNRTLLHDDLLVRLERPHGPMLSVCPVPGCSALTMGGTCVAHDPPVMTTFPRGRPYVAAQGLELEPEAVALSR